MGSPFVPAGDTVSISAQSELAAAKTELGSPGAGTLLPANLGGLTLSPGVYTVPAGTTNLTGTLTLNGQGNLNAFWVFQMPSTLITSPGSVVNVINTGAGAGLYWNVGSSATLDTTTSFEGNVLALTSITLDTGATDQCGRGLAPHWCRNHRYQHALDRLHQPVRWPDRHWWNWGHWQRHRP